MCLGQSASGRRQCPVRYSTAEAQRPPGIARLGPCRVSVVAYGTLDAVGPDDRALHVHRRRAPDPVAGGGEKPPGANPGVAGGQCDVIPLPTASGMAPSGASGAAGSMLLSTFLSPS